MRPRSPAPWLGLLASALVLALAAGASWPAYVRWLAPSSAHVCTCASGSSHASCPVCNASLRGGRSRDLAWEGVPCGDGRTAVDAACQPGVLPAPWLGGSPPFEAAARVVDDSRRPPAVFLEPPRPPPRNGAV